MPETTECIRKTILPKNILRMRKAKKLNKHVHVQSLSHLGLHDAEVRAHMAEDARRFLCRNGIRRDARLVGAMEESADN